MNLNTPKVVLHTDIILDYLLTDTTQPTAMRCALNTFFCYTTVFNAMELFSLVKTPKERKAVEDAMSSMKILGLNAKSAPGYGLLFSKHQISGMNALVAGLCLESKLPILTRKPSAFRKVKGLTVIVPEDVFPTQEKTKIE